MGDVAVELGHELVAGERLVPAAARVLRPGVALLMEIGAGQKEAVAAILAGSLADVSFLPDLQGIPRVALAYRS